jgi:cysteine-rich repeat protein
LFVDVSSSAVCGNHVVDSNEECDDGNSINGDGCSSTCRRESPAVEKIVPPLGEFPMLAIALGSCVGGLLLLILCVVFIKRKHGRIFFCFKSNAVAPSQKDAALKSTKVPTIEKLHHQPETASAHQDIDSNTQNTLATEEFASRMRPLSKPN